jgi:gliding motility-associated-like protein
MSKYLLFFTLLLPSTVLSQHLVSSKPVVTLSFQTDEQEPFVNGYASVLQNNKFSFVNQSGKLIGAFEFDGVRNFSNHLAAVKKDNRWGFINEKGEIVIPAEYDIVYDFKEDITAGYKNNQWLLINKKGVTLKVLDIDIFWGFENGIAKITKKGSTGTMNLNGDIIYLQPEKQPLQTNFNPIAVRSNSVSFAPCPPNIDFEFNNYTNWVCYKGSVKAVNTGNIITVTPNNPATTPTPGRHLIYPRMATSALDPWGLFATNPPDGSNFALKLGNTNVNSQAERVSYLITVPAGSTEASIIYRYAVVFENPSDHLPEEQPRFTAKLRDVSTNTYVDCASYEYVSSGTIAGFYNSPLDPDVKCKAWSSAFINLSAYAGKTMMLEFTTADCTKGRHWGYAYVDVGDCNVTASVDYLCNPSTATLSGPPGFEFYNWWNADYATLLGTGQNTMLAPAPPINTTIHVELIPFSGTGCKDTLDVLVTNNNPAVDAGPDKLICEGKTVIIGTPAVTGVTYSWSPPDYLSNPNAATPNANPPVTTKYYVTASNDAIGCSNIDSVTVTVNPMPDIVQPANQTPCTNTSTTAITFTGTVNGTVYNWINSNPAIGLAASGTGNINSFIAVNTTALPITATITIAPVTNDCPGTAKTFNITVHPIPAVKASNNVNVCLGKTTQLLATGADSYSWIPSNNLSCVNCPDPVVTPIDSIMYKVKGSSLFGCFAYDSVVVTVSKPFKMPAAPNDTLCIGEKTNLWASNANSYLWSPPVGLNNIRIPTPTAKPVLTTRYQVVGYDVHNCFTDTNYVLITVGPHPTVNLGPDKTLSTGTVLNLNAVTRFGPIISWLWNPVTDLSCNNCPSPTTTVKNNTFYSVMVTNIFGCQAADTIFINSFCKSAQVFIPNAFTPDGDGLNDVLMVRGKGISVKLFRIFNRWGELVFEKQNFNPNEIKFGWDGKIRGVPATPDVFVYTAEVICDNDVIYTYKGNTTLLK